LCRARPGTAGAAGAGEAAGAKRELPPWLRGQAWAGAGAAGAGPGGGEGAPVAAGAPPGADAEDVQAPGPPPPLHTPRMYAFMHAGVSASLPVPALHGLGWLRPSARARGSRAARLHWSAVQHQSQGHCADIVLAQQQGGGQRSRLRRQAAYVRAYQEKVRQREAELAARGAGGPPDGKPEPDAKRPRVEGRFAGAAAGAAGAAAARAPAAVKPEPGAAERAAAAPKAEPALVRAAVHCTVSGPVRRLDTTGRRCGAEQCLRALLRARAALLRSSNMSHARPGGKADVLQA